LRPVLYNREVPHNFRDIQGIPGVAPAKTTQEVDLSQSRARLWGTALTEGKSGSFANPVANVAAMHIDPGMKVADFGAGSGAYVLAVSAVVGETGRVYAVDIQKDLLTRIKNNALREGRQNVDIVWGDFEKTGGSKLKDGLLDFVIMSNALFQLEHPRGAFTEAARVLKPTGRIGIVDWSDSFGGMGPRASHVVTKGKALAFAQESGFALIREFPAGAHHYGLLLRRGGPAAVR
jgi:SAM-dependent methyltransferase